MLFIHSKKKGKKKREKKKRAKQQQQQHFSVEILCAPASVNETSVDAAEYRNLDRGSVQNTHMDGRAVHSILINVQMKGATDKTQRNNRCFSMTLYDL